MTWVRVAIVGLGKGTYLGNIVRTEQERLLTRLDVRDRGGGTKERLGPGQGTPLMERVRCN